MSLSLLRDYDSDPDSGPDSPQHGKRPAPETGECNLEERVVKRRRPAVPPPPVSFQAFQPTADPSFSDIAEKSDWMPGLAEKSEGRRDYRRVPVPSALLVEDQEMMEFCQPSPPRKRVDEAEKWISRTRSRRTHGWREEN